MPLENKITEKGNSNQESLPNYNSNTKLHGENLEQKVNSSHITNEPSLQKTSFFRKTLDVLLYAPVAGASALLLGPTVALSAFIPSAGFLIGNYFENKKKKKKSDWKTTKKEFVSGHVMGHADYAIFSAPDYLFKAFPKVFTKDNLGGQLLTTLAFNPLMVIPYNLVYHTYTYLRDNVGLKKTLTGVFTGKIFGYLRGAYQNKIKKELWPDTKNVFKYLFPLHFIQINYLPNPTARMLMSVFINNPIYRWVMNKKKKSQTQDGGMEKSPVNYAPTNALNYDSNYLTKQNPNIAYAT